MRNEDNEQFETPVPSTGSGTGMQTSSGTEETVVEPVETTEGTATRQLYKI